MRTNRTAANLLFPLAALIGMGMAAPLCASGIIGCSTVGNAKADLQTLHASLIRLRTKIGRYPTEQEGLEILTKPYHDENGEILAQPLLMPAGLIDPWGNPYHYFVRSGDPPYGIYSYGEDGRSESNGNDSDDISTWNPYRPPSFLDNLTSYPVNIIVAVALVAVAVGVGVSVSGMFGKPDGRARDAA